MKSSGTLIAAAALAIGVLGSPTFAAPPPPSPPEGAQRTGLPPMDVPAVNGSPDDRGLRAPVLKITSVEVIRTTHAPVMDIIRVRGQASTGGWEEAELVPLTHGLPADGILQLILVARAPSEAVEASGFETVEAIFPLETNHPFKGVSVHGALDSVTVTSLPGYVEGKNSTEDCAKCVGRYFLARGASAAGKPAAEVVREEQLPALLRVIRPGDGIANADSNPNRLTLILDKEGRIATAVWE